MKLDRMGLQGGIDDPVGHVLRDPRIGRLSSHKETIMFIVGVAVGREALKGLRN